MGRQQQKKKQRRARGPSQGPRAQTVAGGTNQSQSSPRPPSLLHQRLEALVSPNLSPDLRAALEATLRSMIDDPLAVARDPALPPDHPLHVQAQTVAETLARVADGDTSAQILEALAIIPRRSPFAPYALAIRAMHALYAGQNDKALALARAIDEVSPAVRLGRAVRILAGENLPAPGKATRRLLAVASSRNQLTERLAMIDAAFASKRLEKVQRAVRQFVKDFQKTHPRLVRRVQEETAYRWEDLDWPWEALQAAVALPSGSAERDRLSAITTEHYDPGEAAVLWRDYLDGVKLSPPERAMVLHRIARLAMISPDFCTTCGVYHDQTDPDELLDYADEYANIPSSLRGAFRQLLASSKKGDLHPGELLKEARTLDAQPETFMLRAKYLSERGAHKELEAELEEWAEAVKDDARPLLQLADRARMRSAPRKALQYITRAVSIDPLNPEVRLHNLRLLVEAAITRLRNGRLHLVRKDLEAIKALEGAADGARKPLIAALEFLVDLGENPKVAAAPERAVTVTGNITFSKLLLQSLAAYSPDRTADAVLRSLTADPGDFKHIARGALDFLSVARIFGLDANMARSDLDNVLKQLKKDVVLDWPEDQLLELACAALETNVPDLASRVTDEALARRLDAYLPAMMLQRGKALLRSFKGTTRGQDCMRIAFTLARRRGDGETTRQATRELQLSGLQMTPQRGHRPDPLKMLSDDELKRALELEYLEASKTLRKTKPAPRPSIKAPTQQSLPLGGTARPPRRRWF